MYVAQKLALGIAANHASWLRPMMCMHAKNLTCTFYSMTILGHDFMMVVTNEIGLVVKQGSEGSLDQARASELLRLRSGLTALSTA